jgi:probable F420-dependent oxidoreductase
MFGVAGLYQDDPLALVRTAQLAEQLGYHQVVFPDHVSMGEHLENYPFGTFPLPPEGPWLEPMLLMAAVASATTRIRLATSVLIAPLRPATLLAKMAATLDQLSHGRLDLGVGVGWQREEYQAQGMDFDARWTMLDDGLRACRKLWTQHPVSFNSRTVNMERMYSTPYPVQAPLPLWFGVAPTPRQARRIAELGQGWLPINQTPDELQKNIAGIRAAFSDAGRDPAELKVRAVIPPVQDNQGANLAASLEAAEQLLEIGVDVMELVPIMFAQSPESLNAVLETAIQL